MDNICVARQPILDRGKTVIGYELQFRGAGDHAAVFLDADKATSRVMVNTFLDFGVDSLIGPGKLAFVNTTKAFVTGELPLPMDPGAAVLEIFAGFGVDAGLAPYLADLVAKGWQIALDDIVWTPAAEQLLPHAAYVKFDVATIAPDTLGWLSEAAHEHGCRLVAMRIDTEDHRRLAESLGFEYFQGALFDRPEIVEGAGLSAGQVQLMQLVATLAQPGVTPKEVEDLVRSDAGLSYRCLRAANSAAVGARKQIGTLREAILMLGTRQLRNWALLMTLAETSGSEHDIETVMTRARLCESLMDAASGDRDAGFIGGLVSGLDRLLGRPLDEVVASMSLRADIEAAVRTGEGTLGRAIAVALAYEHGDEIDDPTWDELTLRRAFLEAVAWSLQLWAAVA